MGNRDRTILDFLANPVVAAMNMTHSGLVLRIFENLNGGCRVEEERRGIVYGTADLFKEVA